MTRWKWQNRLKFDEDKRRPISGRRYPARSVQKRRPVEGRRHGEDLMALLGSMADGQVFCEFFIKHPVLIVEPELDVFLLMDIV